MNLSKETVILLLQIGFWVGALTDGLAVIPLLSRKAGAALFGGAARAERPDYRFAMGLAAALMAGWTLLLVWGAADPLARRGLLLITVFPVISGIVLSTVFAVRQGLMLARRVAPLWLHLSVVSLYYVGVYWLSGPFAAN